MNSCRSTRSAGCARGTRHARAVGTRHESCVQGRKARHGACLAATRAPTARRRGDPAARGHRNPRSAKVAPVWCLNRRARPSAPCELAAHSACARNPGAASRPPRARLRPRRTVSTLAQTTQWLQPPGVGASWPRRSARIARPSGAKGVRARSRRRLYRWQQTRGACQARSKRHVSSHGCRSLAMLSLARSSCGRHHGVAHVAQVRLRAKLPRPAPSAARARPAAAAASICVPSLEYVEPATFVLLHPTRQWCCEAKASG